MKHKLGKLARHWAVKSIAFLLVVLTFSASVFFFLHFASGSGGMGILFEPDYMTARGSSKIRNAYDHLATMVEYQSEEWIQSEEFFEEKKQQLAMDHIEISFPYYDEITGQTIHSTEEWLKRQATYAVKDALGTFRQAEQSLKTLEGLYYYLHVPEKELIFRNSHLSTKEQFEAFEVHFLILPSEAPILGSYPISDAIQMKNHQAVIYFAFDDAYLAQQQALFELEKQQAWDHAVRVVVLAFLGLIFLVYLILVTGKRPDGTFRLNGIDKLWTDVNLVLLGGGTLLYLVLLSEFSTPLLFRNYFLHGSTPTADEINLVAPVCGGITIPYLIVALGLFLSLVRHLKNKSLLRHSLIGTILARLGSGVSTIFSAVRTRSKVMQLFLLAMGLTFVLTLLMAEFIYDSPTMEVAIIVFLVWLALMVGILWMLLKYVLLPYDQAVASRIDAAVAEKMKAEKMKVDLITNVSHDLKTPLTAMINYADLLLQKEPNNEYAQIIYDKSQNLKSITEGLFEVSKAQSGNIKVEAEDLNLSELLEQSLAEFDEHPVAFKKNIADLTLHADGKLMSRVFENLIGNILKYALPGTRAYIDVYATEPEVKLLESSQGVVIVFKNISQYEMNFDVSEMGERFTRGDASRSTEGNGLGLAIAKSYVEACGGTLTIDIDGDLFKTTIIF